MNYSMAEKFTTSRRHDERIPTILKVQDSLSLDSYNISEKNCHLIGWDFGI